jgi:hypothetical protein
MQRGETIATYDLGLALRAESGKFEVTSPAGEIFHVTCNANHSISRMECAPHGANAQPFLVRKVTELIPADRVGAESSESVEAAAKTSAEGTPFLLETEDEMDAGESSSKDSVVLLPRVLSDRMGKSKTATLELFYTESESLSKQPAAWIAVGAGQGSRGLPAEILMTSSCSSFNEFDAEIRKLHAQLDEIRVRARKQFYKAQARAATA